MTESAITRQAKSRALGDVPARERRRALIKHLKSVRAFSPLEAKPIDAVADKLGYTEYSVYCLVYPKFKLAIDGLVKTAKLEGSRMAIYLTPRGRSIDLDEIG